MIKRPQHDTRWRSVRLGEVIQIKHGYAFQGQFFSDSGPYVLLTPGNFEEGGGFRLRGVKEKYYGGPVDSEYVLKKGDLVVVMTEQAEGLLGSSALIPESGRFLHNQRLGRVIPLRVAEVEMRFLYHLFKYREVRSQIRASASGVKVRHTSPSRISEVRVKLPPVKIQRSIANILCCYEDLIENNRRRIEILEEMARTIYRERFENGERGRPTGHFGDLVEIVREGISPADYPGEEFEHFSIPAFDVGQLPTNEFGEGILSGKYVLDNRCVLLSKLNPRIPRVWLAEPSGARRALCSTEFLVLRPKKGVSREFVYVKCLSGEFAGQFSGLALGTSTSHQRVKPDDLLKMKIVVPSSQKISSFTDRVGPMLRLAHNLRQKIEELGRTRDFLLPHLMSADLSVEELEIGSEEDNKQEVEVRE